MNRYKIKTDKKVVYTKEFKEKLVKEYLEGKSTFQLQQEYEVDNSTIGKWIKKSGNEVRCMSDAVSLPFKEKKEKAIELYKKIGNASEVGRIVGVNHVSVCQWVREIGLDPSPVRYEINENFFEKINTEKKAYILGFILADASIRKCKKGASELQISINSKDIDVLEKINRAMKSNYPIKFRKPRTSVIKSGYNKDTVINGNITANLCIYNSKIVDDLIKLGISFDKTYTGKPIKVKKELEKDFWRGCLDGDGSIFQIKKNREWAISMYGTKEICEAFSRFLDYDGKYVYSRQTSYYFTKHDVLRTDKLDILYKNAKIYLDRKYNLYKHVRTGQAIQLNLL